MKKVYTKKAIFKELYTLYIREASNIAREYKRGIERWLNSLADQAQTHTNPIKTIQLPEKVNGECLVRTEA